MTEVLRCATGSRAHIEIYLLTKIGDEVKRQASKCSKIFCAPAFSVENRTVLFGELDRLEKQLLEMSERLRRAREGLGLLQVGEPVPLEAQ